MLFSPTITPLSKKVENAMKRLTHLFIMAILLATLVISVYSLPGVIPPKVTHFLDETSGMVTGHICNLSENIPAWISQIACTEGEMAKRIDDLGIVKIHGQDHQRLGTD